MLNLNSIFTVEKKELIAFKFGIGLMKSCRLEWYLILIWYDKDYLDYSETIMKQWMHQNSQLQKTAYFSLVENRKYPIMRVKD